MQSDPTTTAQALEGLTSSLSMLIAFIVFAPAGHRIGVLLRHPYPWLAWIPVVNLGYFLSLARKPWYLFPLFFVPLVFVFMWIWTFRVIAQRLSLPPWLGFAMFIPVANLITVIYLASSGRPEFSEEIAPV